MMLDELCRGSCRCLLVRLIVCLLVGWSVRLFVCLFICSFGLFFVCVFVCLLVLEQTQRGKHKVEGLALRGTEVREYCYCCAMHEEYSGRPYGLIFGVVVVVAVVPASAQRATSYNNMFEEQNMFSHGFPHTSSHPGQQTQRISSCFD